MKGREKHPYFWLVGAGGPGNYRKRTKREDRERRLLIQLKFKSLREKLPFDLSFGDLPILDKCSVFGRPFSFLMVGAERRAALGGRRAWTGSFLKKDT